MKTQKKECMKITTSYIDKQMKKFLKEFDFALAIWDGHELICHREGSDETFVSSEFKHGSKTATVWNSLEECIEHLYGKSNKYVWTK